MTSPTQSSPDWLTILLGSGGVGVIALFGVSAGFVIRQHISVLRQAKDNLTSENNLLKDRLARAEADKKAADDEVSSMFTILEGLRESDLSTDDAAKLKRVLGGLHRIKSMQEGFNTYKAAAQWLEYRKEAWVEEAVRKAFHEHPKLFNRKTRKAFHKDINDYLSWVYTSLYTYGHARAPLKNFVKDPVLKSPFPYTTAIQQIVSNGDRKELTVEQSISLEKMLDQLLKKIHKEIGNS